MSNVEKRVCNYILKHLDLVMLLIISIIGFIARASGRQWISSDMGACLMPWYEQIKQNGGFRGLDQQVGNYNAAYQTLIALLTYLPVREVYGYKIISCIFDYLIAVSAFLFVKKSVPQKQWVAVLTYGIILLHPTCFFNSAYWGQCDSIYSFWCILTIIYLIKDKSKGAMLLFGIAIGFKLQAVFLLPFIAFFWFYKRSFSIIHFAGVFIGFMVTALPSLFAGKTIWSLIDIYSGQTVAYDNLYLNWPGIWRLLSTNNVTGYQDLKPMAIVLTVGILLIIYYVIINRNISLNSFNILLVSTITVYTCTMFLPAMHERYNYLVMILSVIIAVLDYRSIPLCIVLSLVELGLYGTLFENQLNLSVLACFNCAVYFSYIAYFFRCNRELNIKNPFKW